MNTILITLLPMRESLEKKIEKDEVVVNLIEIFITQL